MKKKAEKRKKPARNSSDKDNSSDEKSKKKKPFKLFPNGKMAILAAVPIAITIYYVTIVAPTIIPVPHTVDVPFPKLTKFLEGVCEWCGTHKLEVLGIGIAFFLPAIFMRTFSERYCFRLFLLSSLVLCLTFISISAPIDRLIDRVETSLKNETRPPPPDYMVNKKKNR